MELNITFIVQINIFFIVFLVLSKMLFFSLEKISIIRHNQILFQKKNIENIENDISVHKKYINNTSKLTTNRTFAIYNQIVNNNAKRNMIRYNYLQNKVKENYIKILQRIDIEKDIVNVNLYKHIQKTSLEISEQLYIN